MPFEIIEEQDEFRMRDDDQDEIDEMWRKFYDVDCRRNRHKRPLFSDGRIRVRPFKVKVPKPLMGQRLPDL